jgi:CHAD domain-containing protein/CYTH domain-containing protein
LLGVRRCQLVTGSAQKTDLAPTTHLLADVLLLSAEEGAAVVARRLLAKVAEERLRLDDEADGEALHDFRVALRQLRSWLRAFRPELGNVIPQRTRRRLGRIARTSNDSRDGQVQLEWLREQERTLPRDAHVGRDWLIERVEARKQVADERFRKRLASDFERTRAALDVALATAHEDRIDPPRITARETFAAAAASVIRTQTERIRVHLAAVHGLRDDQEAHRARIAGKRLRYVLQPIADILDEGRQAVTHLKPMQDALGELHDTHVLVDAVADALSGMLRERSEQLVAAVRTVGSGTERFLESSGPPVERGLLLLAAHLHERAARAFAEVRDSWLGTRAEVLVAELLTLAEQLEALAIRGSDVEIERKYLLSDLPAEARAAPAVEIEQGYLPGERLTERLRHLRDNGSERWVRTVKLGSGTVRTEVEEETTHEVFAALWPLTDGRRVRKRRYALVDGPLTWQIDEFLDRDLVLAEVELPSANVVVEPPTWLAPLVVREVTDEPDFANATLAR